MKLTPHERNEINILRVTQMKDGDDNLLSITPELTPHLYKHLSEIDNKEELIQVIMSELLGEEFALEEIIEVKDEDEFKELTEALRPTPEEVEEDSIQLELFGPGDVSTLGGEQVSQEDLDNGADEVSQVDEADEADEEGINPDTPVFPLLETEVIELSALKVVCDTFFQALTMIHHNEDLALHSLLFTEDGNLKYNHVRRINEIWDGVSAGEVLE